MPKQTKKSLKDLQPVISIHRAKMIQDTKTILKEEAKFIFDDFPDIQAIRWTQRRPLESAYFAPVHKSDFNIDNVEYCLMPGLGTRSVEYGTADLNDCGYDMRDQDWVSPWNDSRVENNYFLDSLTILEEHLFDAQEVLAAAIGLYDRVTVTRKEVIFDNF